jgi:hypothetical protein
LETYLPDEILPDARARLAQLMGSAWLATAATRPAQAGHPEGGIGSLVESLITHTGMDKRKARSWVANLFDLPHANVAALHRQWMRKGARNP